MCYEHTNQNVIIIYANGTLQYSSSCDGGKCNIPGGIQCDYHTTRRVSRTKVCHENMFIIRRIDRSAFNRLKIHTHSRSHSHILDLVLRHTHTHLKPHSTCHILTLTFKRHIVHGELSHTHRMTTQQKGLRSRRPPTHTHDLNQISV